MPSLSRAVLATALAGAGLVASTGVAFAGDDHEHGHHDHEGAQKGLVNVDDTQSTVPLQACNNNIPVNVLGVQVPLQDNAAEIPLLSSSDDDDNKDAGSGVDKNCGQGTKPTT